MVARRRIAPRATMALVLALLGAAVVAPAAGAAAIATSVSGFEGGPALASDGRIVVGERRGNGARRILAVDPATRAVSELASFPPLADPTTYSELAVTGTRAIATARLSVFREAGKPASEEEQPTPLLLSTRTMTVLPSLNPLESCAIIGGYPPLLAAAAGDGFVATVGYECASNRSAVRLRTAAGTVTVPAQTGPADASFPPDISELRATGSMVAWVETRLPGARGQLERTLVIARGTTGQVLARTRLNWFPVMMGLGADGTVVLMETVTDFPCAVRVISPAAPTPRRIALGPPCGAWNGAIAVSGGRFVYGSTNGAGVSDLEGAAHPLAEATGPSPIAFDGRTAYVTRSDCDADRLLAVDAGVSGPALPAGGPTTKRCPVRRAGRGGRVRIGRNGSVRIALRCPSGCRGTLRLVEQRRGRRERIVGSADYVHGRGSFLVRVPVARFARGLSGCAGGLRAHAVLFGTREQRRGLGQYRIVSQARCRRTGGPAFKAPLPGPRA